MSSSAELEEDRFLEFLANPEQNPARFDDELFARCLDAAQPASPVRGTPRDIGILIRQAIRRMAERDAGQRFVSVPLRHWLPSAELFRELGVDALPHQAGLALEARPWAPEWLEGGVHTVDRSCLAGTKAGERRRVGSKLRADEIFTRATGHEYYTTPGQRAAVRAAVTMDPGDTLIAMLPTGSGKTEVALALATRSTGTTVIVVPTVALAMDFERRFRSEWARRNPAKAASAVGLPLAWTGRTGTSDREVMLRALARGKIPWLVTSPEALAYELGSALKEAAAAGRVGGFVVDEAHLVTQWGRDFRSDFRQLPGLRRELLEAAQRVGHPGFVTLLMSATLGDAEVTDLAGLFGQSGRLGFVAANELRTEPEFWIASVSDRDVRLSRLLEALDRLPRPLILYATKPSDAEGWKSELSARGYGRVAVVTGQTPGDDRRDVLEGLRTGTPGTSRYDVVVATSAFGLGIDYSGIRTVVHGCVPETMDRWYQEVGRGGRDGDLSTAVLLPATHDFADADSLGLKLLSSQTAWERWHYLWNKRRTIEGRSYVNVSGARRSVEQGSYNRRWNRQILQALEESRAIERKPVSGGLALELTLDSARPTAAQERAVPDEWEEVTKLRAELDLDGYFSHEWQEWRDRELASAAGRAAGLRKVIAGRKSVCAAIRDAYTPGSLLKEALPEGSRYMAPAIPCGACPDCRRQHKDRPDIDPVSPPLRWPAPRAINSGLENLLEACPSGHRLSVIVADDLESTAVELGTALVIAGVRYVAGLDSGSVRKLQDATREVVLSDQLLPGSGSGLPPLPALILLQARDVVSPSLTLPVLRPLDSGGTVVPLFILCDPQRGALFDRRLTAELALRLLETSEAKGR